MRTLLISSLVALSVLTPGTAQASMCSWQVTELSVPAGTTSATIAGVAADGSWAVGAGEGASGSRMAILWHDGAMRSVPLEPNQKAMDVNSSGTLLTATGSLRAGRAHRGGVELNPLPGAEDAWAVALNTTGTAVGYSRSSLVTWPADSSQARLLPGTDDGTPWFVRGIDDAGRAVGENFAPSGAILSYVWDENGDRTELKPLPGHTNAVVSAIRNGRIVGDSSKEDFGDEVGVEWDLKGNVIRTFDEFISATRITASGDVLGLVASYNLFGVVRATAGHQTLPWGILHSNFADTGDVYGSKWSDSSPRTYRPVLSRCE